MAAPTVTYGGDEVSALVFDIGSTLSKVGYAGEDTPKCVFPSWVGYVAEEEDSDGANGTDRAAGTSDLGEKESVNGTATGENADNPGPAKKKKFKRRVGEVETYHWRPNMELKCPMSNGIIEDWDALEAIWDHAYFRGLRADPTDHPLLMAEPSWNPREVREKLAELAFEKYSVPAFYLAKSAVLSAYPIHRSLVFRFAAGRASALVLDSGGGMTSVVPVYDGYVLKKGIFKQAIAGDFLSEQALLCLKNNLNANVVPQYMVARKEAVDSGQPAKATLRDRSNTHPSFHRLALLRTMHELKETVCQTLEVAYDETLISQRPVKAFEFPDGFNTNITYERFRIPEIMFNPQKHILPVEDTSNMSFIPSEPLGVQHLIQASVTACDPDIRATMFSNVVLTGGNTLFPGFVDRVYNELSYIAGIKVKLHAAGTSVERKFSPWIGGSILASLGTFHQLWISKKEYEEIGPNIIEKR
ncbi:Actin-like protein 6B [Quaeritorhiza haematococci]|nr:Actin-like protein 6B [Quaeritorhiza haematococci]